MVVGPDKTVLNVKVQEKPLKGLLVNIVGELENIINQKYIRLHLRKAL